MERDHQQCSRLMPSGPWGPAALPCFGHTGMNCVPLQDVLPPCAFPPCFSETSICKCCCRWLRFNLGLRREHSRKDIYILFSYPLSETSSCPKTQGKELWTLLSLASPQAMWGLLDLSLQSKAWLAPTASNIRTKKRCPVVPLLQRKHVGVRGCLQHCGQSTMTLLRAQASPRDFWQALQTLPVSKRLCQATCSWNKAHKWLRLCPHIS